MGKFYIGRYSFTIEMGGGIISNSECVATIIPAWWMYNWSLDGSKERNEFCNLFNMDEETMGQLCEEITQLFEEEKLGYPNVIFSLKTARYLYAKYFKELHGIKLVGIGLDSNEAEKLIYYLKPRATNEGEMGIYKMLKKKIRMDQLGVIGYDILGYELGIFHSYFCPDLEGEIREVLKMKENIYGLFDSYTKSVEASRYINFNSTNELALWQPWVVCEYGLYEGEESDDKGIEN